MIEEGQSIKEFTKKLSLMNLVLDEMIKDLGDDLEDNGEYLKVK